MNSKLRNSVRVLSHSITAFLLVSAAKAQTWDGGGGDDLFGTAENWSPDGAPVPSQATDITFAGTTRLNPVSNYGAFDDFHSITFDASAGAFTLTGNAIDLFGKIENYSTALQTVTLDLAINAGQAGTGEFNPVNGDLLINSANVFTNGNTLRVFGVNNKTVTFGANTVISQAGNFVVEQTSNVIFLGANTYSGATNVNAGTLTVGNGGTTGQLGIGAVTVASGATLTFNRSDAITVSNVLGGAGSYVKSGAGTLTLSGANTFTGTLTISNGTVNAGSNTSALGAGSVILGDANTGSSDVAYLATTAGTARPITVSANGTGTATIGTTTGAGTGVINFSGPLTLNRPTTMTSATTDRTEWSGKVSGNVGTLTIAGGLRTVLSNLGNDFVGDIIVTGTNTILQTGVSSGTEHIPNGSSINIGAGAFVKLAGVGGAVETINALNGTGTIRRHEGVNGNQTLALGSAGGSGSFGGKLENGTAARLLAIRKEGAGTQTITSVTGNTASGGITVNGGVLKFTGTAGFDAGTFSTAQTYTVNNGGTLEIGGDWLTKSTSTYTINAGGTLTFSSPGANRTLNYVNNLNVTDGTVSGTSMYRVGNNTTATHNFSGDAGSTISSGFSLIKNGASQTVNLNVADGAADADLTVSGVIQDDPALFGSTVGKLGEGKMVLTAANTYVGPTNITAGTLQLGNGGTTGSLAGPISNNATLAIHRSGAVTIGNLISGTGVLNHTGTGTTTLTGANTYTGATNVSAGTLITTAAQTGATAISVADGATFGAKLNSIGATFNTPSLAVGTASGATLLVDTAAFGNPTAPVINAASFTPAASTTLRILGSNLSTGTFTVLDYGTIGGANFAGLLLSLPFRVGGSLVDNTDNTSVDVTISGAETAVWQGNVVGGAWDIDPDGGNTAGSFNWKTSILGTSTRYAQGATNTDVVTFDDTATGTTNVNLTTTLTPISLTVNNSTLPYTFGGSGKISGTTGITKQGNGTLILANTTTNDYTGGTTISGGTLQIGDGVTAGSGTISGAITNNATLAIDRPDDMNLANPISGAGVLLKSGAGKTTLTVANTFSGGTTIRRGTLEGTVNSAFGSGLITLGDAGTGTNNVALYLGNRADISNNIEVSANGTGTVTLGASNTGIGANAASFLGSVTLNRPTTFSGEITIDRLAFDGKISGNVETLTISGGARTTFANTANDFIGNIVITGAGTVLQASVATAAEVIPNSSTVIVDAGAVLQLASASGAETIDALYGTGTVRTFASGTYGSGLIVGSAGGSGEFAGSLQNGTAGNPLSLTKAGSGTQILSGINTYTGTTTVAAGTLAVTGTISGTHKIDVQGGATLDVSGVGGGFILGFGQTLAGNGNILGATTIEGTLAPGASPGTLTFNSALAFSGGSSLMLELEGPGLGQVDKIAGVTNLTLDGTITVSLISGYNPIAGESFDVLDWSGTLDVSGFSLATDLLLPGLAPEYSWDTNSFLVDGTLHVVPEPGSATLLCGGIAVGLLARRRRK